MRSTAAKPAAGCCHEARLERRTDRLLSAERAFTFAAAALALAMLVLTGWVASSEWFSGDDFAFLAYLNQPEGVSWSAVWLPFGERFWPFYRPLGMESYFRLAHAAFGLAAPGYFAVSLLVHFARGWVVARLARQLGCDRITACVGGLLGVCGGGSLPTLFAGSIFHYVLASFSVALCVSWFLDALRGGGRRAAAGAVLATAVALLSNESAVVLPALLFAAALLERGATAPRSWPQALRRVAPHALLVAVYLALRLAALTDVVARPLYASALDLHALRNAAAQIAIAAGGRIGLALLAALVAGGAIALWRSRGAARDLARGSLLCLVWIALALLPFVVLPFPHPRFSIACEAPLALLAAIALATIARTLAAGTARVFAAAGLLLPLLAFPWAALLERGRHPEGEVPQRLVAWIEQQTGARSELSRVVVLYGVEGLADAASGERVRVLTYNGGIAPAIWSDRSVTLRFHDLNQRMPRAVARPNNVFVALLPDLRFAPPSRALLDREFPRAFAGRDPAAGPD